MKKNYLEPEMEQIELLTVNTLLAGSIGENGGESSGTEYDTDDLDDILG